MNLGYHRIFTLHLFCTISLNTLKPSVPVSFYCMILLSWEERLLRCFLKVGFFISPEQENSSCAALRFDWFQSSSMYSNVNEHDKSEYLLLLETISKIVLQRWFLSLSNRQLLPINCYQWLWCSSNKLTIPEDSWCGWSPAVFLCHDINLCF